MSVATNNPTDREELEAFETAEVVNKLYGSMIRKVEDSPRQRNRRVAVDKPSPQKPSLQAAPRNTSDAAKRLQFGIPVLPLHKVRKEDDSQPGEQEMGINPVNAARRHSQPTASPKESPEENQKSTRNHESPSTLPSPSIFTFTDSGHFLGATSPRKPRDENDAAKQLTAPRRFRTLIAYNAPGCNPSATDLPSGFEGGSLSVLVTGDGEKYLWSPDLDKLQGVSDPLVDAEKHLWSPEVDAHAYSRGSGKKGEWHFARTESSAGSMCGALYRIFPYGADVCAKLQDCTGLNKPGEPDSVREQIFRTVTATPRHGESFRDWIQTSECNGAMSFRSWIQDAHTTPPLRDLTPADAIETEEETAAQDAVERRPQSHQTSREAAGAVAEVEEQRSAMTGLKPSTSSDSLDRVQVEARGLARLFRRQRSRMEKLRALAAWRASVVQDEAATLPSATGSQGEQELTAAVCHDQEGASADCREEAGSEEKAEDNGRGEAGVSEDREIAEGRDAAAHGEGEEEEGVEEEEGAGSAIASGESRVMQREGSVEDLASPMKGLRQWHEPVPSEPKSYNF